MFERGGLSLDRLRSITASLGAGDSLLHAWIIPRLPHELPACLTLASMHGAEVVARLLDARLDFGIARSTEVPDTLRTRRLGTITFALYVPRRLRPRRRTQTLARHDLPASKFDEVDLLATPARNVVFAWHGRIERQRPRVAALIDGLVAAFALR